MELSDVKARVEEALRGNSFYEPLLRNAVMAFLSGCRSPEEAFLSECVLSLCFRPEGFAEAAHRYEDVASRIEGLDLAVQAPTRSERAVRTLRIGIDFDHAANSGMSAVDAAVHAIRDLGAKKVRMLRPPQPGTGVRGPDSEALGSEGSFAIESKLLRGRRGFAQLASVLNSILATSFLDGKRIPGVSVRTSRGVSRDLLDYLSPEDLATLQEQFRGLLDAFQVGGLLTRVVDLGRPGRRLDFRLKPSAEPFVHFSPDFARPASALPKSYPGWGRLERKIRDVVLDEALPQLAASHDDGRHGPNDLVFIGVPNEGSRILHQREIRARLAALAAQLRREHDVRLEIRFG